VTVEGALQTPDGACRVEIVKRGQARWYRVVHGDNVVDWLSIAAVERVLAEAGVDMAVLVEVPIHAHDTAWVPQMRCRDSRRIRALNCGNRLGPGVQACH
jgi:hypothetical protein